MARKHKQLTLSIIIPAYNEEDYLESCLESIAEQTVKPVEVIVVDNNSSDSTAEIASGFKFVKLVSEKRQHQSYAQHTGFCLAQGDIIGRIDADTILPTDWVEKNVRLFETKPDLIAATGSGEAYDIALKRFGRFVHRQYFRLANSFAGHPLMWGSNCAFRKKAWAMIKDDLLLRSDIWEDYDLGFCLGKYGDIKQIADNDVLISYRSIHKRPLQQLEYHARSVRTFFLRRGWVLAGLFALAWCSVLLLAPLAIIDYYFLRPAKNISMLRGLLSKLALLIDI